MSTSSRTTPGYSVAEPADDGPRVGRRVTTTARLTPPGTTKDPRASILRDHVAVAVSRAAADALHDVPQLWRADTQVVLAAHDYAVLAVREFLAAYHAPTTWLRAVHSIAVETSRLLRPLGVDGAWRGRALVLTTAGTGGGQARRWATAMVRSGRIPAVAVVEVSISGGAPGEAADTVTATAQALYARSLTAPSPAALPARGGRSAVRSCP
jgi:hypothetical protein